MPGPLDYLKQYFTAPGAGTPDQPYAPWQKTLQRGVEGGTEAIRGLIGAGPDTQSGRFGELLAAGAPMVGGAARLPRILEEVFAANPAARGSYERAMASQLAQMAEEKKAADAARYARAAEAHDALLDLAVADRPRPIPTETGWETAIPLQESPQAPAPSISPKMGLAMQTPPGFESKFTNAQSKYGLGKGWRQQ